MWDDLLRVDWKNLHHAYGRADDAPAMLWHMVSGDRARQERGWGYFWGSLHHQGDYYNSTVAVVPFLIEAAADPVTPCRAKLLSALEGLWRGAPNRGGYPDAPEPPDGTDVPTPLLDEEEFAAARVRAIPEPPDPPAEPDDDAFRSARPADLCAWQTGRAVRAGQETYLRLLGDADAEVVRAAASLLAVWPETRATARRALAQAVERAAEPADQVRLVLEFGKSALDDAVAQLERWIAPERPLAVRTAAALAWAVAVNPDPVPPAVAAVLSEASEPGCPVFPNLPQLGAYSHWGLPPNLGWLVLRLARSTDKDLRWRMVQNFEHGSDVGAALSDAEVVPVLLDALSDRYGRIRDAAAHGLARRGPAVLARHPDHADMLIDALRPHPSAMWGDDAGGLDSDASACGHIAHLLACGADRLTAAQRTAALAQIKAASERFRDRADEHVRAGSVWHNAHAYLERQHEHLARPVRRTLPRLLAEIAHPRNDDRFRSLIEADRELADRYERSPPDFLVALRKHLAKSTAAGWGAVEWLRKLGPAAAPALDDLDQKAATISPPAARWEVERSAAFVRWSQRFDPPPPPTGSLSDTPFSEWLVRLKAPDAHTRALAAESVAALAEVDPVRKQEAVTALRELLEDDTGAEFGVNGRCEVDGRVYFWRWERTTPRASAAMALFALGHRPDDDLLFRGLLAESGRAAVVCGDQVVPCRFPPALWRLAVQAAGGASACERLLNCLLQELGDRPYRAEVNEQYACSDEVRRVVALLSLRNE